MPDWSFLVFFFPRFGLSEMYWPQGLPLHFTHQIKMDATQVDHSFFIIELRSRKVIHAGVTKSPADAWTAQQLREATPF